MRFFLGLGMMLLGGYLILSSIRAHSSWGWGASLYRVGGFSLTTGTLMIPFAFGVGIIFYNYRNILGWILALGSIVALIAGVIISLRFSLRPMSAFDLIVLLVLLVGGTGIFLSSLRNLSS